MVTKQTTVAIPKETADKIDKFIEKNPQYKSFGRSGVISSAIDYFDKHDVDFIADYTIDTNTNREISELSEKLSSFINSQKNDLQTFMQANNQLVLGLAHSKNLLTESGEVLPEVSVVGQLTKDKETAEDELSKANKVIKQQCDEIKRIKKELSRVLKTIEFFN